MDDPLLLLLLLLCDEEAPEDKPFALSRRPKPVIEGMVRS